ncbi:MULTISPECIES: porin family protein [unclassified Methylobacterium]|uniref:outer membrane protein n=1 Tax=unclassified Methylobacterium TaxID=2615210 RepID=UPI0011C1FC13|nr:MULTISPECIES: porin family protein [unclassified Methylobacterium]QEE40250.1 porin family protein [Methylobacterium sp. WL1]TXN58457.1 porin family protein [Methylobacterium sp. WL2]
MKTLLTSLAAFTALTAAATAADLPRRAPPPVFTPVPVFTWTGFYFGINAGYGFDASSSDSNRGFVQTAGSPAVQTAGGLVPYRALAPLGSSLIYNRNNREGFSGGGQIGYNYQFTPGSGIVIGFEADAQYLDFGGRPRYATNAAAINPSFVPVNGTLNTLDFFGTVRGRLGYAFDKTLVYATGGFAYATGTDDGARVGLQNFAGRRDDFKTGYTVGGGAEFALPTDSFLNFFRSSAVTFKVEGLYVSLDRNRTGLPLVGAAVTGAGVLPVYSVATSSRNTNDFAVVRAGLNYKFGSY